VARFSHGSRRALPWAVAQKARPMPRMVRLGRAANDNGRRPNVPVRALIVCLLIALAVLAVTERLL
jgi:hypothetical protein